MKKKIKSFLFFSVITVAIASVPSFAKDDTGFHHWQKRLVESKDSKNVVLLEMLGEAAEESDGLTFRILQIHGPHLFYGDNPNNKRDFQRFLLNIFKTHDLLKLKSFYEIKEGGSDLLIARVFQIISYLYMTETGFTYRLREYLKDTLSWEWGNHNSGLLISNIIESMDEFLGPKVSYHIRARVKNIQKVGGTQKVAVVAEWELVESASVYNPQKDELETKEEVIEKSDVVSEFLDKAEADKIEGDYGTKTGLPLEKKSAIDLFQNLSKTAKVFENPREIRHSNWKRLMPLLPGGVSFVLIPEGTFDMGSPGSESDRADEETLHQVTLTKSFEIMTTEVTQKQWEEVMGSNPSYFKGEDLPVENVSWNDAQAFISKLNERNDGYIYRLPTEAEWEYAARGGTKTAYSFGDNPALLHENGWFIGNSEGTTHPVASCKANGFGLYDMHGNVWEWVSDYWHGQYPTNSVTDPAGPSSSPTRVIRGGSWGNGVRHCRSAYHGSFGPDGHDGSVGFRLARTGR